MAETGSDIKIVFTPSGRQGHVPAGTTVLQAARTLGVDIDSVCGGRALCGRCQVDVGTGEFAKHGITSGADSLCGVTAVESRYAEKKGLAEGRRLSCQSTLQSDVVIDVPPESQVHNQLVRKAADDRKCKTRPEISASVPRLWNRSGRNVSAARLPVTFIFCSSFSRCFVPATGR